MTVKEIVRKRGADRENLLQILHDIQDASGDHSLHTEAIGELAGLMNLTPSDIVGTASFYTMFSFKPRGRHIVRVCESPPCHIMGAENVLEALRRKLGVEVGGTTPDGLFTLELSSCLGACGVAPVMMIDETMYGNLTNARVAEIIDQIRAEA